LQDHAQEEIANLWDEWHTYEIIWKPDYVQWTVDGKPIRTVNGGAAADYQTKPQNLFMTYWSPTMSGWGDGFNDSTMPWYLFYDWVEVHTYDTKTKEFSLEWREDFTGEDGAHINTDRFMVRNNYGPSSNRRTKAMSSNVYIYEDVMTI